VLGVLDGKPAQLAGAPMQIIERATVKTI